MNRASARGLCHGMRGSTESGTGMNCGIGDRHELSTVHACPRFHARSIAHPTYEKMKRPHFRAAVSIECPEEDSNLQGRETTSTSSWRVCQFRHLGRWSR